MSKVDKLDLQPHHPMPRNMPEPKVSLKTFYLIILIIDKN